MMVDAVMRYQSAVDLLPNAADVAAQAQAELQDFMRRIKSARREAIIKRREESLRKLWGFIPEEARQELLRAAITAVTKLLIKK